ncbi:hypothetical protein D3C81_1097020 [compost metagenome]
MISYRLTLDYSITHDIKFYYKPNTEDVERECLKTLRRSIEGLHSVQCICEGQVVLRDKANQVIGSVSYKLNKEEEYEEIDNRQEIYLLTFGHESIVFGFKPSMDIVCKSLRDLLYPRNKKVYEIVEENDLLNVYDSEGSLLYIMPYTLGRTIMISPEENKELKESNSFK